MKTRLLIGILFISAQLFSQKIDPEEFDLTDSTLTIKPDIKDLKDPILEVFDNVSVIYKEVKDGGIRKYQVIHNMKYLHEDAAIEQLNRIYLPSGQSDSLVRLRLRVIENGSVVKEQGLKDIRRIEEDNVTYSILAVEGLKKGQMLELMMVRWMDFDQYGTVKIQGTSPVKIHNFKLQCPSYFKFVLKTYPDNAVFTDTVLDGTRYQEVTFKDIPAIRDIEYLHLDARAKRLEYTLEWNYNTRKKLTSWADKGRNLMDYLMFSTPKDVKTVQKLISKNGWDKETGYNQIYKIEHWVKTNLRLEKGLPANPEFDMLVKNRYGDMTTALRFYIVIFKELDIQYEVLFTCEKAKKFFDPEFCSSSYMEDGLFYFPMLKLYMDPLDLNNRLGDFSSLYLEQGALFVKPVDVGGVVTGLTTVRTIPAFDYDSVRRFNTITVDFPEGIEKNARVHTLYEGRKYGTDGLKAVFHSIGPEKRDEFLEENARRDRKGGTFKVIKVDNIDMDDPNSYRKPLVMEFEWTTETFNEQVGDRVLFKLGDLIGQQLELYDKETREYPIDEGYPHVAEYDISISVPEGYTVKGFENMAKTFDYKDANGKPLFGITVTPSLNGNKFEMKIREYYARCTFPVSDYSNFRTVINAAADVNKYTLLLEKK